MRKFLHLIIICLFLKSSFGQVGDKKLNVIPQTPNAASLYKYTETPVSYYNGTTGISIPVYEISVGSIKIPISLSYGSGGIKVGEDASWVGLGWNLSVGGSVSQNVVGRKDENTNGNWTIPNYMKHNIVPNSPIGRNNQEMNVVERGICFPDVNGTVRKYGYLDNSDNTPLSNTANIEVLGASNREYDLYMYNFNGHSGKLINPKLNYYTDGYVSLDNNNIKFIKTGNFWGDGDFKAVTTDGTVYLFNSIESIQSLADPSNITYNRHLTSITTPEGRVVNFIYKQVTTVLFPTVSHSYTFQPSLLSSGGYTSSYIIEIDSRTINDAPTIQAFYLEQITWDNGKVTFYSDSRSDMVGGNKLNNIQVFDKNDVRQKLFEFTYDYFIGNIAYGDYFTQGFFAALPTAPNPVIPEAVRQKRLRLLSVKVDSDPPYTFNYSTVDMPYKSAFAKDIWDYFNGANFTNLPSPYNNSFLVSAADIGYYDPAISLSMYSSGRIPFGKRYTSATHAEAGSLKKVTYPTGGYTTYEYESNRFTAPDNVSTTIQPVSKSARDGNNTYDHQVETFTIPTVDPSGFNIGKISVRISCDCSNTMGTTLCNPFTAGSSYNLADGLYALLEIWNTTTSAWDLIQKWDLSVAGLIQNNSYTTDYNFIQGKQYRITANYPDRAECPGDFFNKRVADIQVFYYSPVSTTTNYPNEGGGIRIKRITDYNVDGQVAIQRELSYEGGKLITKPLFHRLVKSTPFTKRAKFCLASDPCNACELQGDALLFAIPGTNLQTDERFEAGFYSQPHIPYSYSANGSLVGYDKVTLEYKGSEGNNGKTEFEYNNKQDITLDDYQASIFPDFIGYYRANNLEKALLPGIPGIKDPLNGKLKVQIDYERTGTTYRQMQKTSYTYGVVNKKVYWAFKVENTGLASLALSSGQLGCSINANSPTFWNCVDAISNYLYFYPVYSYNTNLVSKTHQYYDGNTQSETITTYTYNTKNQPSAETTTDSKGHQISNETIYIADNSVPSSSVKTEMVNRNMIDFPVEKVSKNITLNKELNKAKTTYQFWNGTSIILPGIVESSSGGSSTETDITYNSYDNKGNVLQLTGKDGVLTCYVWAYQQNYPVAKIVGATYANVLSALTQTDQNLPYLQTMSDAALETELNKIRDNLKISVPKAQVSTFLYKPLVGIKQATDANGRKMFYEYDTSNRLLLIKDNDGNIIKTFEYQYR